MDALGFLSKASTKFLYEVAPVALASVIGTMLINHYSHRAIEVVVQPAPPPPDAIMQTLHDEHQLIVDYLKRDVEAKEAASDEGSAAPPSPPLPPTKDAPAKRKAASGERVSSRPHPKQETTQDPLPIGPALADSPERESPEAADGLIEEGASMAGALGGFVASAWQYSARALPNFSGAPSAATRPSALRSHSALDERR